MIIGLLLGLVALTVLLRGWELHATPPWLWWDEAGQGLDARDLLHGQLRFFFPRSLGKEPLYIYLIVPFVALWDGTPAAVRLGGLLCGALIVPALYAAGRALWHDSPRAGAWAGLAAGALWAVTYWPQSINRIAFRANTLPLVLTLAVVAWLAWTRRPGRRRALAFGVSAGLVLLTYLAGRITLLLWPLFYVALPADRRGRLRATLPWALLAFLVILAPLAFHFTLRPEDAITRVNTFPILQLDMAPAERLALIREHTMLVAGAFLGQVGDPIPRHNIPGRPPYSLVVAGLFFLGLIRAAFGLFRREQWAWTLFLWWFLLSLPAVLAADANPHFLRLFGALPAALLLAAWPVGWAVRRLAGYGRPAYSAVGLALLIIFAVEGVRTTQAYFVTWANSNLYHWFQGDLWTFGEEVAATPEGLGIIPLNPKFGPDYREYSLQYAFPDTQILQVRVDETTIGGWLEDHVGTTATSTTLLVPDWREGPHVDADPKAIIPFYLRREGTLQDEEAFRGFNLRSYSLDAAPTFENSGRHVAVQQQFLPGLILTDLRWGTTGPDVRQRETQIAAGASVWAIMEWELTRSLPDLKVTLDVVDEDGHRLNSVEQMLLDERHRPVSQWTVGESGRSYHLVQVPVTQPPGEVTIEARAYEARTTVPLRPEDGTARRSIALATLSVTPAQKPTSPRTLEIARRIDASLPDAPLTLLGTDGWPESMPPGTELSFRLFWQVEAPLAQQEQITVSVAGSDIHTTVAVPPGVPVGYVVHTYADLHLPPTLAPGRHRLLVGRSPDTTVALGDVTVVGRPRQFEVPALSHPLRKQFGNVVELLGVDVPAPLEARPGETITFRLIWRVLRTPDADLVRFVHVLGPDGRPLAQEDTVPCAGECPSRSWLPDEVLVETARVSIPPNVPAGTYPLAIGWYDVETLQRLPLRGEAGTAEDTLVVLPVSVEIMP